MCVRVFKLFYGLCFSVIAKKTSAFEEGCRVICQRAGVKFLFNVAQKKALFPFSLGT